MEQLPPTTPWRLECLEDGAERLVIPFPEPGGLSDWLADLWLAAVVAICILLLIPLFDRPWVRLFAAILVAILPLTWVARARQPAQTVIDFARGLAYYRYRRRWAAKVRHYPLAAYGLVLSHPWGEGYAIGVYLSGQGGEFEVARFRDAPAAAALRGLLAERLNLRLLGIV